MSLIDYRSADRNINKIALTFDDGPNPFWTRKILDILDVHDIRTNFFVLGVRAKRYPEVVKDIYNRGHLIGNHSYSHPREGCADFEKAEEAIFNITGAHTFFIRPPYNNTALCNCYEPALTGDVKIINNDVVPKDWKNKSDEISKLVLEKTRNGSIILLHDGSEKDEELESRPQEMFKMLPNLIVELKKNFEIVRLDELVFI